MSVSFTKVTTFFAGRHTTFIIACFIAGGVMSWFHKLDANYVTLLLGLQGMVLAHSTQENYFRKDDSKGG